MEEVPILFQELRLFIKGVLLGYIILSWTAPPSPSSTQKCDDRGKFLQRRGKKEIEIARLNGRRQVLYTLSRRPILLFFVPLPVAADKEVNLCVKCQFLRFIENESRGCKNLISSFNQKVARLLTRSPIELLKTENYMPRDSIGKKETLVSGDCCCVDLAIWGKLLANWRRHAYWWWMQISSLLLKHLLFRFARTSCTTFDWSVCVPVCKNFFSSFSFIFSFCPVTPGHPCHPGDLPPVTPVVVVVRSSRPLANYHPEGPASCKLSSRGAGLLQIIIRRGRPLANESSWGAGLVQMIIQRGRPLANDHPEGPASCKWSSGPTSLLQMIIRMTS